MTNDEAIKILNVNGWGYTTIELRDATQMAKDALEKQIPKKLVSTDMFKIERCCPSCGEYVDDEMFFITDVNYCPVCGQAFDWSEAKE